MTFKYTAEITKGKKGRLKPICGLVVSTSPEMAMAAIKRQYMDDGYEIHNLALDNRESPRTVIVTWNAPYKTHVHSEEMVRREGVALAFMP